jgi:hypothetical protein
MDSKPVNLTEALASFDDVYSPGNATDAQLLAFEDTWHAQSIGRGLGPDALCDLQPEAPARNQRDRLDRHEPRVDLPGPHLVERP